MPKTIEIAAHTTMWTAGAFSNLNSYFKENKKLRADGGDGLDIIVFSEHNHFASVEQQAKMRVAADRRGFDAWCGTHVKVYWDWHEMQAIIIGVYPPEEVNLGGVDINSLRDTSRWVHDNGGVIIGLNVHVEGDAWKKSLVQYVDAFAYNQDYAQDEDAVANMEGITAMADPPLPLIKCAAPYYHKSLTPYHCWHIPDEIKDPKDFVNALRSNRNNG